MLAPTPLKDAPRYPVTAAVATAALAVTAAWWSERDIDALFMNGRVWAHWELWRALTSTLPHINAYHLAFNVYWLWTFGTLVERVYGHVKFAAILLLLAFGSSLAEFALFYGGVGLSGVGYGLWAMLWVLERRDERFAGAVDRSTSQMFVGWFFLCILLTITNTMPVANVAHGAGAALGALLGLAASSGGALRWMSTAGLLAAVTLCLAASTVLWPWVSFSEYAEADVERAGLDALERDDYPTAVHFLKTAVRMRHAPARAWYNLGVVYQRMRRYEDSAAAYSRAADMPDATSDMKESARDMKSYLARKKATLR